MTNNDNQPEGGHAWELSAASRKLAAAVGNEAAGEAALDLAAAITNGAMAPLISSLETVLRTVVRKEVGTIERRMIDADRATVDYRVENTTLLNHRFDNFGTEIDQITENTKDLQAGIAVLQAEFQTVGETVDGLAAQLAGIVASIVEVRAQAAERTREIYARLDAHNDKLSSQEEAFGALRAAVDRLETQLSDLHKQTLGDVLSRERRLELTKNNESVPALWELSRANTAAIERLQRDVAEISRLLADLHHRMEGAT